MIGSGPAGLAAAQQLNRAGHLVTVFERDEVIGGLLALGIPHFKLEKTVVNRRVKQMADEGIEFRTSTWVGHDYPTDQLKADFPAIVLCGGGTVRRLGRGMPPDAPKRSISSYGASVGTRGAPADLIAAAVSSSRKLPCSIDSTPASSAFLMAAGA